MSHRHHKSKNRAFTLIELLVVISIIGLLSSVVLSSLESARVRSRDTARKVTLRELQKALELYFSANGSYPISYLSGAGWYSSEPGDQLPNNSGDWIPGLSPTYMGSLPRDPRPGKSNASCTVNAPLWKGAYIYRSDGQRYAIAAHCSPEGAFSIQNVFYDPIRPTWAWKVCSDPTACGW